MIDVTSLRFDDKGLIPAIVSDADTGSVLTLAYMNKESLALTMEKGITCFWSRSRNELWIKGETSGNYQHIVDITADCDADALLVRVRPDGPACHTGEYSCFHKPLFEGDAAQPFSAKDLFDMLAERKKAPKEGSYTSYLFEKGLDKILKKVGEESTEVIIGACANDKKETVYEIADLGYHLMVLMVEMGISLEDVKAELGARHVVDKKVKQEKMTK